MLPAIIEHMSACPGPISFGLPPASVWTYDASEDRLITDSIGVEVGCMTACLTRRGIDTSMAENAIEDYIRSHEERRAEHTGYRMQESIRSSNLHPMTKTLMPTKRGLMRRWIRGKVLQPSIRAVIIPHDDPDSSLLLVPDVALSRMGLTLSKSEDRHMGADQQAAIDINY